MIRQNGIMVFVIKKDYIEELIHIVLERIVFY